MSVRHLIRTFASAAIGAALALAAGASRADLASEMDHFFNEAAFSTVTAPGVYKSQAGGMITGGGLVYRVPQQSFTLMSVQLPRIRTGCGGIDLFAGGFSFVNADQLVAVLKNIGAVAKAFAYQLALSIISPQIKNTLNDIWSTAQKYLNQSITSCEAARKLIGAGLKHTAGAQYACIFEKVLAGEDFSKAQVACQSSSASASPSKEVKDAVSYYRGNLVWEMTESWLPSWDSKYREYLMSLTGTVIADPSKPDEKGRLTYLPSLAVAGGEAWMRSLLEGGKLRVYQCDTTSGCMNPTAIDTAVPAAAAFRTRVQKMLDQIQSRIATDQPLDPTHQQLLNMTSLPVYRYLVAVAAGGGAGSAKGEAEMIADLVARDMLYGFLMRAVQQVRSAVRSKRLPEADDADSVVGKWLAGSAEVLTVIRRAQIDVRKRFDAALTLVQRMRVFEQLVASRFSVESLYFQRVGTGGRR
ncbi:MAG TPA: hypothetical protein ENK20_12765 [Chromatiales bacterium]|nr:hypothetical protein [Chromatiales bacterium]